ncbi:MAG: DUF6293 family protein [Candidatus Geothermarchaeales archaeon]
MNPRSRGVRLFLQGCFPEGSTLSDKKVTRTLQIATLGSDPETVLVGIRNFPIHKLALVCTKEDEKVAYRTKIDIERTLDIPVDIHIVQGMLMESILDTTMDILEKDGRDYEDIIVNVAGGEKILTCSMISAAFIHGLRAFHVMAGETVMLPVLKLSYSQMVSRPKLNILRALDEAGGRVGDLKELSEVSGYPKPLLSYHLRGTDGSRGLENLGLVEIERGKRSRAIVKLTTLGKLLIIST